MENMETMNTMNTEMEVVTPEVVENTTPKTTTNSTLKDVLPGIAGFLFGMAVAYGVHKYQEKKNQKGVEH